MRVSPALTALPVEIQPVFGDYKIILGHQPLLQLRQIASNKINHFAAFRANKMVMVFGRAADVTMLILAGMNHAHQTEVRKNI
jgi:hypothetical protein